MSQTTTALIVAATTAAVSLLGVMIQDWLARRSRLERRQRLIEDTSRRVALATEWWNAMQLLSPQPDELTEARARSMAWLQEATTLVAEVEKLPVTERSHLTLGRVLLIYRFQRRSANVIRLCFYLTLTLVLIYAFTIPTDRGTSYFATDFVGLGLCVFLTLLLRAWAVTAEKHPPRRDQRPPSPSWPHTADRSSGPHVEQR